jgi:hypothetical protein
MGFNSYKYGFGGNNPLGDSPPAFGFFNPSSTPIPPPIDVTLYSTNFSTGTPDAFPSGWSRSTPGSASPEFLWTNDNPDDFCQLLVPGSIFNSNGYSGASGGFALLACCGEMVETTASVTLSGQVNTQGYENIRVHFGYSYYEVFSSTPAFAMQWSSDGVSWNNINIGAPADNLGTWTLKQLTLPVGAENQSNLRFRFTYDIGVGEGSVEWMRAIDDFKVIGDTI